MALNHTLMHKNIPVADVEINKELAAIVKIGEIYDVRRVPVGVNSIKGNISLKEINYWLKSRSIPASRAGIQSLYERLDIQSPESLIFECHGLSLSDHYWLCPVDLNLDWHDVNFFENDFSRDVGKLLFGQNDDTKENINLMSPDNTADGCLKKAWVIREGKRCLIKSGTKPFQQEPYNEVIASALMRRFGISHVPYTLFYDNDEHDAPLCVCDNFLSVETEFVSAAKVASVQKLGDTDSILTHLLRCCETVGIGNIQGSIDKMIALDYIIANEDRHMNNFGFIRNADTLEWVGFAPIFDSGTSLWHNSLDIGSKIACKPFRQNHDRQLELVSDLSWFHREALEGLGDEICDIFLGSASIGALRCDALIRYINNRSRVVNRMKNKLKGSET